MMNDERRMMNGGREEASRVCRDRVPRLQFIIHHSSFIILTVVLSLCPAYADSTATRPSTPASRPSQDLRDVSALMSQAARRIDAGKPDATAQTAQRKAVQILDRLIEEAEQAEKQQQQNQCKSCGGKGCRMCLKTVAVSRKSSTPAQQSTANAAPGGPGELKSSIARPGEAWGNMRPEDREKVLQSIGKDFPSQYRQLVEQYYKQLAKEE